MPKNLNPAEISHIRAQIANGNTRKGYPALANRLFSSSPNVELTDQGLYVPDGPWHTKSGGNDGPESLTHPADWSVGEGKAPLNLTQQWLDKGYDVDQHGLPLHPNWRQLLDDPQIGWATGRGFFYKYGPNLTVDAVVYRFDPDLQVLLIQRQDCGLWALPGGFVDDADLSAEAAARRELKEEAGIAPFGPVERIGHFPSIGPRSTLNAWCETTVFLFHCDTGPLDHIVTRPGSDASAAEWFNVEDALKMTLYSGHKRYLLRAIKNVRPF